MNITVSGKTIPACVCILKGRQEPLLGKPEIKKLRIQFDFDKMEIKIPETSRAVRSVTLTEESIKTEYPKLFSSEVGKIPGYKHKIRLTKDAIPAVKKLCTLPLSVQDQVSEQLKKLEKDGIISRIDSLSGSMPCRYKEKGHNGSADLWGHDVAQPLCDTGSTSSHEGDVCAIER